MKDRYKVKMVVASSALFVQTKKKIEGPNINLKM